MEREDIGLPSSCWVDWNFRQKILLLAMKGVIRAYMYICAYMYVHT